MVFYLFLSVSLRAQVSFFLPNFDAIRTKEAEMEPEHIACFGRGERVFIEWYRVLIEFTKSVARVL